MPEVETERIRRPFDAPAGVTSKSKTSILSPVQPIGDRRHTEKTPAKFKNVDSPPEKLKNFPDHFSDGDCDVDDLNEIDESFLSSQASNLLSNSTQKPKLLNEREKLK